MQKMTQIYSPVREVSPAHTPPLLSLYQWIQAKIPAQESNCIQNLITKTREEGEIEAARR